MIGRSILEYLGAILIGVSANQVSAQAIAVAPATRPSAAATTTPSPRTFEGRVIDADDKPIANAKVWLIPSMIAVGVPATPIVSGSSDAQGHFKLEGDTSVRAVVASDASHSTNGVTPLSAQGRQPDAGPDFVEVRLPPGTNVRIKLLDPSGKPAAGVPLVLGGVSGSTWMVGANTYLYQLPDELREHFNQTSDADGICMFKGWPQDSAAPLEVADDRYTKGDSIEMLTLRRKPVTEYTLQLLKASSISGKVVYGDTGKPVVGAMVRAANTSTAMRGISLPAVKTDEQGVYIIKRVPAGAYSVAMTSLPDSQDWSTRHAATPLPEINVPAGMAVEGQDIQLGKGATLTGKVVERGTAKPLAGIRIAINDRESPVGISLTTMTKEDGSYELHSPAGEKSISVLGSPLNQQYTSMSKSIVLQDNQVSTSDFELTNVSGARPTTGPRGAVPGALPTPDITVHGTVVDVDGKPVANATITAEDPPRNAQSNIGLRAFSARGIVSDAKGQFTMAAPPGGKLHAATAKMATMEGVPVPAENQEVKLLVRRDAVASAMVRVIDEAGQPISNVPLTLMISIGQSSYTSRDGIRSTDTDGTWLFTDLPSDRDAMISTSLKGYGRTSAKLTLQPGKQVEQVITLKKADSYISGMAMDDQGNPLAGATIMVQTNSSNQQRIKTDETGQFRVEGLVKGESASVYLMDNNRILTPVRAEVGSDQLVVLLKPAAPTATGRGARGAP